MESDHAMVPTALTLSLNLSGSVRQKAAIPPWMQEAMVGKGKEVIISGRQTSEEYDDDDDDDVIIIDGGSAADKKKRFHRHTPEQIKELENLFKETQHPSEYERLQLANRMGLSTRQVKFWFQNRRIYTKTIGERNEISNMKTEMEKMSAENTYLKEAIKKILCNKCRLPNVDQQLMIIENDRLFDEIKRLLHVIDTSNKVSTTSSACGINVSIINKLVGQAIEELSEMASMREYSWLQTAENSSRETINVIANTTMLVQFFMNVHHWKNMFPSIISKAAILEVINEGEGPQRDGAIHLMSAEYQMLTSTVPKKKLKFIRHCKQLSLEKWAIVDLSLDNNTNLPVAKFGKLRPSGCIFERITDKSCRVTWIEHLECKNISSLTNYQRIINAAFGARHWATTLQQQCERLLYIMDNNFPTQESNGLAPTALKKKSTMILAQKMTIKFCRLIGASNLHKTIKLTSNNEDDMRIFFRRNTNDPEEPIGLILCAVKSIWLPLSRLVLFDYLKDTSRKHEWDIMLNGKPAKSILTLAKGHNKGNFITIQGTFRREDDTRILQDSSTNGFESMLVFSSVDKSSLQSNSSNDNSGEVALLPSGFSILQGGMESRSMSMLLDSLMNQEKDIISGGSEEEQGHPGCLLTLAFQILASNSPMDELSNDSMESVSKLVWLTLRNIKNSFMCD